jgi:hypothetical protein
MIMIGDDDDDDTSSDHCFYKGNSDDDDDRNIYNGKYNSHVKCITLLSINHIKYQHNSVMLTNLHFTRIRWLRFETAVRGCSM